MTPSTIMFYEPPKKSGRFVAQQGIASLGTNVLTNQGDLIASACQKAAEGQPGSLFFQKWIMPGALKPQFLRNLRAMNIAAHSLFPGLDGVCRSVGEDARLAVAP